MPRISGLFSLILTEIRACLGQGFSHFPLDFLELSESARLRYLCNRFPFPFLSSPFPLSFPPLFASLIRSIAGAWKREGGRNKTESPVSLILRAAQTISHAKCFPIFFYFFSCCMREMNRCFIGFSIFLT